MPRRPSKQQTADRIAADIATAKEQDKAARNRTQADNLGPGDTIDFGLSAGFKFDGTDWWAKAGGGTTIRPGETVAQARKRLADEVVDYLDEQVSDIQTRK